MRSHWSVGLGGVFWLASVAAIAVESPTPLDFNQTPGSTTPPPPPLPPGSPKPGDAPPAPAPSTGSSRGHASTHALFYEIHLPKGNPNKNKAFLLGAVRMPTEVTYPLSPVVEKAFASATVLAVQSDPTSLGTKNRLNTAGTLPSGSPQTLRQLIPARCFEQARAVADEQGMQFYKLNQLRPWAAALLIENNEASMAGLRPEDALDLHYVKLGRSTKDVVELEGVDNLLDAYRDMPSDQQAAIICKAVADAKHFKNDVSRLYHAWRSSEAGSVSAILEEQKAQAAEGKPSFDAGLAARNQPMAEKIAEFLGQQDSGPYFVIVGAEHLLGANGILALLEEKGFVVEQK
jgi:uncharacterized protein YbaP (TraB family)